MIIMDLKLRKILGFEDNSINFSYARKPKNNPLGCECLKGIPTFNYKKVNLIMGSNSSGKTSLGRVIKGICNFIKTKEAGPITRLMPDESNKSSIQFDCIFNKNDEYFLYRFFILLIRSNDEKEKIDIQMDFKYHTLRQGDTYQKVSKVLSNTPIYGPYLERLNKIDFGFGWNIAMPITEKGHKEINFDFKEEDTEEYRNVLEKVLKTLDPNIKEVKNSNDSEKAFVVKYDDGKTVIVQNKQTIADLLYFSSGTKYGFRIADILYSIKTHQNGLYYVDELFSYINSDIEVASLSNMIHFLGDDEQLFFTTHNAEIMNLTLPLHCFSFLGKENINGKPTIKFISASEFEKRNNVIVKNLYDNDIFGIAPSTKLLFEIGE